MAKYIELEYKDLDGDYVLIDLRSEGEHEKFTIPNSINIPILDNEERKIVGTTYDSGEVEEAKSIAVKVASKKLPYIYDKIKELESKHEKVVLFCARGGMRSTVLDILLTSLGSKVYKLKDGYKGYRAYINYELPQMNSKVKYVVLQGNTGAGKTKILKELKNRGYDILDLEGCANHRGSFLGSVGIGNCNSQKTFESLMYNQLKDRNSNLVFVEGESKRIGNVLIPNYIYDKMSKSDRILISTSLDTRVENIVDEYTLSKEWKDEVVKGLNNLKKYISEKEISTYINMLENNKIKEVVKNLMENYYDPMYKKGQDKYEYVLNIESDDINIACDEIENWIKNHSEHK